MGGGHAAGPERLSGYGALALAHRPRGPPRGESRWIYAELTDVTAELRAELTSHQ